MRLGDHLRSNRMNLIVLADWRSLCDHSYNKSRFGVAAEQDATQSGPNIREGAK